jgi:hypothetical protein
MAEGKSDHSADCRGLDPLGQLGGGHGGKEQAEIIYSFKIVFFQLVKFFEAWCEDVLWSAAIVCTIKLFYSNKKKRRTNDADIII